MQANKHCKFFNLFSCILFRQKIFPNPKLNTGYRTIIHPKIVIIFRQRTIILWKIAIILCPMAFLLCQRKAIGYQRIIIFREIMFR